MTKLKEIKLGVDKKLLYIKHGKYLECDVITLSVNGRWTTRCSFSLPIEALKEMLAEAKEEEC